MDKSLFYGAAFSLFLFVTPLLAQKAPDVPLDECAHVIQEVSALLFHDSKARDDAFYELSDLKGGSLESVSLRSNGALLVIHGAEDLRKSTVRNLERLGFVFEQLSADELATIPRMTHKPMPVAPITVEPDLAEPATLTESLKFRSNGNSKPLARKLVWLRDQSQTIEAQVRALAEQFDLEVTSYKPGLRQAGTEQIEVLQIQIRMAPEAAGTIPRASGFIALQPL